MGEEGEEMGQEAVENPQFSFENLARMRKHVQRTTASKEQDDRLRVMQELERQQQEKIELRMFCLEMAIKLLTADTRPVVVFSDVVEVSEQVRHYVVSGYYVDLSVVRRILPRTEGTSGTATFGG